MLIINFDEAVSTSNSYLSYYASLYTQLLILKGLFQCNGMCMSTFDFQLRFSIIIFSVIRIIKGNYVPK